jgi:hypothetical protein
MSTLTLYRLGNPETEVTKKSIAATSPTLHPLLAGFLANPQEITKHIIEEHLSSLEDIYNHLYARFDLELLHARGYSGEGVVARATEEYRRCTTTPNIENYLRFKLRASPILKSSLSDAYRRQLQGVAVYSRLLEIADVNLTAFGITEQQANMWQFAEEKDSFFRGIEEHVRGDYAEFGPVRIPILSRREVEFTGDPHR